MLQTSYCVEEILSRVWALARAIQTELSDQNIETLICFLIQCTVKINYACKVSAK